MTKQVYKATYYKIDNNSAWSHNDPNCRTLYDKQFGLSNTFQKFKLIYPNYLLQLFHCHASISNFNCAYEVRSFSSLNTEAYLHKRLLSTKYYAVLRMLWHLLKSVYGRSLFLSNIISSIRISLTRCFATNGSDSTVYMILES